MSTIDSSAISYPSMNICCVAGSDQDLIKLAAVIEGMAPYRSLTPWVMHTGPEYEDDRARLFFDKLGLPRPRTYLGIRNGSHAQQIAATMAPFAVALKGQKPDLVLVVGDLDSSVACGLVAAKLGVPVAHLEAGLRSFDRGAPDEVNRVVTDSLSNLHFATERSGVKNLRREGVPDSCIVFAGSVRVETLLRHRDQARGCTILEKLGLEPASYALAILEGPALAQDLAVLERLVRVFSHLSRRLPIIFPLYPRARAHLKGTLTLDRLAVQCQLIEPPDYLDTVELTSRARLVITDSGDTQEEASIFRVPCLTLRARTERVATVDSGWNQCVGTRPAKVFAAAEAALSSTYLGGLAPENWDGKAGQRIANALVDLASAGPASLHERRSGFFSQVALG